MQNKHIQAKEDAEHCGHAECSNVAPRRGSYDLVGPSHTPTTRSLFPIRRFIDTWLDPS